MAGLIRVVALAPTRRRAGFAFTPEGLVLGPENFERGLVALFALAALLSDPVLTVTVADDDTPDVFRPLSDGEREAIVEAAAAAAEHDDPEAAEAAADAIFTAIVGAREEPVDPADRDRAERLATAMAAEAPALAASAAAAPAVPAPAVDAAAAPAAAAPAADTAAAPAAATPAAEAATKEDASKGEPAPADAKASTVAKPASSSGRKPKAAAANTKAAKG